MMNTTLHPRGMTLVSIILAIVIFSVGVLAVLVLMLNTQSLLARSSFELEAQQIAREGIEALRSMRDTNWKQNYPWDTFLRQSEGTCYTGTHSMSKLDTTASYTLTINYRNTCPWFLQAHPLPQNIQDLESNYIAHTTPRGRSYYRVMTFSYLDNNQKPSTAPTEQLLIESTVYWNQQGLHSTSLQTILTNWQGLN